MNELTKEFHANRIHPKHYALHMFSAIITLGLACACDVWILEYLHNKPHTVLWSDGTLTTNFVIKPKPVNTVTATQPLLLGESDDGRIVWKVKGE